MDYSDIGVTILYMNNKPESSYTMFLSQYRSDTYVVQQDDHPNDVNHSSVSLGRYKWKNFRWEFSGLAINYV